MRRRAAGSPPLAGFAFAMFGTVWAWINYSWFASAYDTDDWLYRVLTMVQMVGVLVFALGLPPMFRSIDEGGVVANDIMVAGYVVMRIAMVLQWLRAAKEHRAGRSTALRYAFFVTASQIGWIALLALREESGAGVPLALAITLALDLGGPLIAEKGGKTPWHPHHIAERYGLLAIIALGEGILGTIAAVSAVVDHQELDDGGDPARHRGDRPDLRDVVVLLHDPVGSGAGGAIASDHWVWGYSHIFLYAAIAASGAGLHVAAYQLEGESHIGTTAALLTVVVPVLVFGLSMFAIYTWLVREARSVPFPPVRGHGRGADRRGDDGAVRRLRSAGASSSRCSRSSSSSSATRRSAIATRRRCSRESRTVPSAPSRCLRRIGAARSR